MTEQLDALIAAAEAGTVGDDGFCDLFHAAGLCKEAENAYHGSLDSALALHAALLPGWAWSLFSNGQAVVSMGSEPLYGAAATPARALLLATLKAYRATLEDAQ